MKKILKSIANTIPYIILLISFLLIINAATSIKKGETPSVFGRAILLITSGSMEDTIMTGDIIIIDVTPEDYNVGDIITFYADLNGDGTDEKVTHRIVAIDTVDGVDYFTTKGDNNATNPTSGTFETAFTEDRIIGKYTSKSSFLGSAYSFIFAGGYNIIFIVVILVFIAIGVMEVFSIIRNVTAEKQKQMLEEKEKLIQEELEKLRKQQTEKDK